MESNPAVRPELKGYPRLLEEVKRILAAGKERARVAVEVERVRTYWEAGGALKDYLSGLDARHGDQVVRNLAADTGLSAHRIYEMVQLRERFANFPPGGKLTWSHYRRLIPIENRGALEFYLREATRGAWSVRDLETQIKADAYGRILKAGAVEEPGDPAEPALPRLSPKRGELYVYRVTQKEGRPAVDLGFKQFLRLPEAAAPGFQPGDTVRSIRDTSAAGGYRFERTEAGKRFYSYRATVARVIDGDTLWATVDYGFDILTDEKLRLRGIDTPEVQTEAGKQAKVYLETLLASAQPFVVTTTKVDLYDRYLADVFVMPGEADLNRAAREGRFVNRELIAQGYARLWVEERQNIGGRIQHGEAE